jgi:hypothetical protein
VKTFLASLTYRAIIPASLALLLSVPADAWALPRAEDHLVSPQAMQEQMIDSASNRQENIKSVTDFLSTPIADQAIRNAHYNPEQVRRTIPTLSDQELATLAARSKDAQQKFAAGALSKLEIGLIAIAFVVVIVVIIVH